MLQQSSEVPDCRGGVNVGIRTTCMPPRGHRRWLPPLDVSAQRGARFPAQAARLGCHESALGITVHVISLAVVMQIVSAAYASDQMSRAAPAPSPSTRPPPRPRCNAIIRELQLAPGYICNAEWTINIDTDLVPDDLPKTLDPSLGTVAGTGDMVFVRIGWERDALTPGDPAVPMVAMGLARSEP